MKPLLKPGEVERWPAPGTPRPTGPARVWIEVELEIARRRLGQLLDELQPALERSDADD